MLFNIFKWLETIQNGQIKGKHVFQCEDGVWAILDTLSAQNILPCAAVGAWRRNSRGQFRKQSTIRRICWLFIFYLLLSNTSPVEGKWWMRVQILPNLGKNSFFCSEKCNSSAVLVFVLSKAGMCECHLESSGCKRALKNQSVSNSGEVHHYARCWAEWFPCRLLWGYGSQPCRPYKAFEMCFNVLFFLHAVAVVLPDS